VDGPRDIKLSDREFERLATFVRGSLGIKMPPAKRIMLESRLSSRVRALSMESFEEYCALVFDSPQGADELRRLVDAVTTNKTEFFREDAHFEHLTSQVLPEMMARDPALGHTRPLRAWSAGCSSGEEPYTLSMVLTEFASRTGGMDFEITATDLSSRMLETALKAVYRGEIERLVPAHMRRKYLLRSRDRTKDVVRVAPAIRRRVRFGQLNLLNPFQITGPFDLVFCRNVLIYFDRDTQIDVLGRVCDVMTDGGYLFVGHSETLHGMHLPLRYVAPTIYVKEPPG
jgi:chemotaxis protein methyltransferase CheR